MRADRLISLLILLQTRGRMSARQLASKLEVSERTIYRDVLALSSAGVPVYSDTGCNGGFSLVESYRTNLTGLTEKEVRALFMLSIPAPLMELGVADELRTAQLKLTAALSNTQRNDAEKARQRIHIDSSGWSLSSEAVPHLGTIRQALWEDGRMLIGYEPVFSIPRQQLIEPLGLVAKAGVWYLVYQHKSRIHIIRMSDISSAQPVVEHFERPADFDLQAYWERYCKEVEESSSRFKVRIRVEQKSMPEVARRFGDGIFDQWNVKTSEWTELELSFESFEAARQRLLGLGRAIEVLEPLPLRYSILDFAQQIIDLYRNR